MLKAVLFDLGGTLLHYYDPQSDDPQRHFWRITRIGMGQMLNQMAAAGFNVPAESTFSEAVGRRIGEGHQAAMPEMRSTGSIETLMRSALAEFNIQVTDDQWAAFRPAFYLAIDSIVTPRTGIYETLQSLKDAGYRIGLISNTFWAADVHDRHLTEHNLIHFFDVRVYSSETPYVKPHTSIFHDTLNLLGVEPQDSVYVGDRPDVDVIGAQRAGMFAVLIQSPYLLVPIGDVVPDAMIHELPDLLPVLDRLGSPA
jgi:putative hydrolase of the HAD superfamily